MQSQIIVSTKHVSLYSPDFNRLHEHESLIQTELGQMYSRYSGGGPLKILFCHI